MYLPLDSRSSCWNFHWSIWGSDSVLLLALQHWVHSVEIIHLCYIQQWGERFASLVVISSRVVQFHDLETLYVFINLFNSSTLTCLECFPQPWEEDTLTLMMTQLTNELVLELCHVSQRMQWGRQWHLYQEIIHTCKPKKQSAMRILKVHIPPQRKPLQSVHTCYSSTANEAGTGWNASYASGDFNT